MSKVGAQAVRRSRVEREFQEHAREIAAAVAAQFQPVYERVCRERDAAVERAAILQTVVERIALGIPRDPDLEARQVLEQLGIVPDVQTEETSSGG